MKKLLLLLFALPLTFYGQTVTDIAPGNHVSIKIPGHTAYTRTVILLHAIYDGEQIPKNLAAGTLVGIRGGGHDRTELAYINTSSSYTTTYGSVTSINNYNNNGSYATEQWELKKVRYNGTLYLALKVPYRNAPFTSGFRFTGWAISTAPEQMKLISYYNTQQNEVLHEEVYNSLEDFTPNNAAYHHYSKSVFSGKVGIGTDLPDAKLTVNGDIHTKEVKVDLNGAVAPDYVFKEGYELRSLEEVQAHIKEKGHLPGIPSAKEMEEEGINLKEMNLKLLEKVEELTLYIFELKEENRQQERLLETLIGKDKTTCEENNSKKTKDEKDN
ncbi:tail fiber protein [Sinomicrobium kalidii]|uniref:tail fiber protein n=1 Tax=Sinomicrobium kalidii TaxID=2900738 RepID=UPI001E4A0A2B|nr:tail fiber protein [Sinomicrobium kalidii]UGU18117.1 tail fiber protein [Sinomicrobium kalidii]